MQSSVRETFAQWHGCLKPGWITKPFCVTHAWQEMLVLLASIPLELYLLGFDTDGGKKKGEDDKVPTYLGLWLPHLSTGRPED